MSKLCLENVQFLSESNLDGFDFILDEFANEYNYLESVNEASISDTVSKAIAKLKELWKSFVELIKDTVRKIKIKAVQMLAKLKLKEKEEQKGEQKEEQENKTNEIIMDIPKIFSDTNNEGSLANTCLDVLNAIYNNGFKTSIQCIEEEIKRAIKENNEYEYIYKNIFIDDNDSSILNDLLKNSGISMYVYTNYEESIYDSLKRKLIGENVKTKISFNNKNGIDIKRTLDLMVSYLKKFESDIDRLETEGLHYINSLSNDKRNNRDNDNNYNIYYRAVEDFKKLLSVINKSSNALLRYHVSMINVLYTLINKSKYIRKYVTFTKT